MALCLAIVPVIYSFLLGGIFDSTDSDWSDRKPDAYPGLGSYARK